MRQLEQALAGRLDRLLGAAPDPLGLAVSGGGDSVALLALIRGWARSRGRRLLVLTVDHGLRPEAKLEAERVAALADRWGLDHRTLRWPAPVAVQARARRARHGLLAAALREAGGAALLTGHTRNDQRETFLMRARQGSGWYGLAGVDIQAPSPAWPAGRGVTLVRPLLDLTRHALRRHLAGAGLAWSEDPSNEDPAFERVRMRRMLAEAPNLAGRIDRVQVDLARLRRARQRCLAELAAERVDCPPGGPMTFRDSGLDEALRRHLVAELVQIVAGTARRPDGAGLASLLEALPPGHTAPGRTLGGAWIWRRPDALHLARDPGAAADARIVDGVWDGRFLYDGPAPLPVADPGGQDGQARASAGGRTSGPPGPQARWRCLLASRLAHRVACWRGTPFG